MTQQNAALVEQASAAAASLQQQAQALLQALSNAGVRLLTALGKRGMLSDDRLVINLVRGNDAYLSPAEKARPSIKAMRRCLGVLDRYHASVWVGGEGPEGVAAGDEK